MRTTTTTNDRPTVGSDATIRHEARAERARDIVRQSNGIAHLYSVLSTSAHLPDEPHGRRASNNDHEEN